MDMLFQQDLPQPLPLLSFFWNYLSITLSVQKKRNNIMNSPLVITLYYRLPFNMLFYFCDSNSVLITGNEHYNEAFTFINTWPREVPV